MSVAYTSLTVDAQFPLDPATLSPSAWWKSDTLSGADGDPVGSWADSSGNGRTLTAAGAARPMLRTKFLNDFDVLQFDGTDDVMTSTATLTQVFGANGVGTILAVVLPTQADKADVADRAVFADSNSAIKLTYNFVDGLEATNDDGAADTAAEPMSLTVWHLAMYGKNATDVKSGVDNLRDAQVTSTASGATANLAGTLSVGALAGPATFLRGFVAEILVFNSLLSEADRLRLAHYFYVKYRESAFSFDLTTIPFIDVTQDVVAREGIDLQYGISGNGPFDRVATTGTLSFTLNNSAGNSAGKRGYYSPGHADARQGFEFGTDVRLAVVFGGDTIYQFRGSIDEIFPRPGKVGPYTRVTAADWMDDAARAKPREIVVQTDITAFDALNLLVADVGRQPGSFDLVADEGDTFPVCFDNVRDDRGAIIQEFQRIANSDLGFVYTVPSQSAGTSVLRYESRSNRGGNTGPNEWTLTDAEIVDMNSGRRRDDLVNRARVVLRPRRIDAAAITVLASIISAENPLFLARAALYPSFIIYYRDPAQPGIRAGGTEMVSPVATTDYTFNSLAAGTGDDLTAQLTVTATFGGNAVVVDVLNNGPRDGFLTKLQVRGKGVYAFDPVSIEVEDEDSIARHGENVLSFEMPYQGDIEIGLEAAAYVLARGKDPFTQVDAVRFLGNESTTLMEAALTGTISERVGLSETATGVSLTTSPDGFFINGIRKEFRDKLVWVTWALTPRSLYDECVFDQDGFSEFNGPRTRFGFSIFVS